MWSGLTLGPLPILPLYIGPLAFHIKLQAVGTLCFCVQNLLFSFVEQYAVEMDLHQ